MWEYCQEKMSNETLRCFIEYIWDLLYELYDNMALFFEEALPYVLAALGVVIVVTFGIKFIKKIMK